jgi:hypothetical protein
MTTSSGNIEGTQIERLLAKPHWGVVLGILALLVGLAAWLWPRSPEEAASQPALYALRVQVVDPHKAPVEGARVRASAGNEPHLLPDGWWQVEIAQAKMPRDHRLTVWAEHPDWTAVRQEVTLGADPNPRLELVLQAADSALQGTVQDARGRGIPGARVSVVEQPVETRETDQDGRFRITIPLPPNKKVTVHVEHRSYAPQDAFCYVGSGCQVYLGRR